MDEFLKQCDDKLLRINDSIEREQKRLETLKILFDAYSEAKGLCVAMNDEAFNRLDEDVKEAQRRKFEVIMNNINEFEKKINSQDEKRVGSK